MRCTSGRKEGREGAKSRDISADISPLHTRTHMHMQNIKFFKVYRWDPEQNQKPYLSTYPVDLDE